MATRVRTRIGVAAAVLAVIVGIAGVSAVRADPTPSLPPVTAADLLASVATAAGHPTSVSGEVLTVIDLGLPELPAGLGGGAAGPIASFTGNQRYKVWVSPDGVRVAHLTDLGEEVWVSNHTTAWHWNSDGMKAERIDLGRAAATMRRAARAEAAANPGAEAGWGALFTSAHGGSDAGAPAADPAAIARQALSGLAPYGSVAVDGTARVAGRPVYELTLTPSSPLTLIGRITVAVDAATRIPLRLQVFAKGADTPSIQVGFTTVSFDAIDPGVFDFTPPQGATIVTPSEEPSAPRTDHSGSAAADANGVRTFGTGFDTRVAVPVSASMAARAALVLPYQGPLASGLSVDVAGRTWILFGPVGIDTLRSDAASLT
jgi:hypothetical protein